MSSEDDTLMRYLRVTLPAALQAMGRHRFIDFVRELLEDGSQASVVTAVQNPDAILTQLNILLEDDNAVDSNQRVRKQRAWRALCLRAGDVSKRQPGVMIPTDPSLSVRNSASRLGLRLGSWRRCLREGKGWMEGIIGDISCTFAQDYERAAFEQWISSPDCMEWTSRPYTTQQVCLLASHLRYNTKPSISKESAYQLNTYIAIVDFPDPNVSPIELRHFEAVLEVDRALCGILGVRLEGAIDSAVHWLVYRMRIDERVVKIDSFAAELTAGIARKIFSAVFASAFTSSDTTDHPQGWSCLVTEHSPPEAAALADSGPLAVMRLAEVWTAASAAHHDGHALAPRLRMAQLAWLLQEYDGRRGWFEMLKKGDLPF